MNLVTKTRMLTLSALAAIVVLFAAMPGLASDLEDLLAREGKTRLLAGNHVEPLLDGPESFERRLQLVQSAQHHLLISSFIWKQDEYGVRMLNAVAERIQEVADTGRKLEVLIILDDITPHVSYDYWSSMQKRLRKAGAKVRYFNPPRWGLVPIYGARLHDKVVIVDGRAAIVGGRNYSDHYFVNSGDKIWFDADILIEGPAVEDLQMHWLKSWLVVDRLKGLNRFFASPEKTIQRIRSFWRSGTFSDGSSPLAAFANRDWFPHPQPSGTSDAAILYDNPLVWDQAPTVDVVIGLVERAQFEVDIVTPFPNLPPRLMAAVTNAIERGVRVRLLTNSESTAVRGGIHWRSLLPAIINLGEAGVEIWGWTAGHQNSESTEALTACAPTREPFTGLHAKLLQVDRTIGIITASNFNIRSNWYNTEAGVLVNDVAVAEEIRSTIDTLIGKTPLVIECRDGSTLSLKETSVQFTEAQREAMKLELGDSTSTIEAYGPAF